VRAAGVYLDMYSSVLNFNVPVEPSLGILNKDRLLNYLHNPAYVNSRDESNETFDHMIRGGKVSVPLTNVVNYGFIKLVIFNQDFKL
jgi:hypothetical protein